MRPSPQPYTPYQLLARILVVLAGYGPFLLTYDQRNMKGSPGAFFAIGVFLLGSGLLRMSKWYRQSPDLVRNLWMVIDFALWFQGQSISQWSISVVYTGLVLCAEAAFVGWNYYRGALHCLVLALFVTFGPLITGMPSDWTFVLGYFIYVLPGLAFVYGLVHLAGRASDERQEAARARTEAELANVQLREYASQVEELAVLKERNRLARDVHDTIAHGFTSIIMQLEAVSMMVQRDPAKADTALAGVREMARDSLAEVRRSVHALRPLKLEEADGLPAIRKLVDEFSTTTGVKSDLVVTGVPARLTIAADLSMFRTVQEGLANSFRHGRARHVHVAIDFTPERVLLSIENDGRGLSGPITEGLGIVGMRERAAVLGGELHVGPGKLGGFVLRLTLPTTNSDSGDVA